MTDTAEDPDRLLTLSETAERMRITDRTLYDWRMKGRGPRSAKIGGRVWYRASDVTAWLDAQWDRPA